MNKVLSFLVIVLLVLLCACRSNTVSPTAEGPATTKTYKVGSFNAVEVMNSINVKYSQGKGTMVKVTANAAAFEYLKVKDSRGKLEIYFDVPKSANIQIKDGKMYVNHRGKTIGPLYADVELSSSELRLITAYNSVDFEVLTPIKGTQLTINAFNSADVELNNGVNVDLLHITAYNSADIELKGIQSDDVTVEAFNSADVDLAGRAKTVNLTAFNSAELEADKLTADNGSASVFNSAEIKCKVGNLNSTKYNNGKITNL